MKRCFAEIKTKGQQNNLESNIIECRNLTLAYDGSVVIKDLSFDMPRGEIMLVSGENGSGKSTLIRALLGLIKPISGRINLKGIKRGDIGYLPQQSGVSRDFPATVKEVVYSGFTGHLRFGMFYPENAASDASRAMKLTGVDDLQGQCFNELSGGQQQRVLLSRALCAARELLILDEPTNTLDPASAADMYSIITSLKHEHGMSVVMVSHDLETSVTTADRVLHLCCDGAFCCAAPDYEHELASHHRYDVNKVI